LFIYEHSAIKKLFCVPFLFHEIRRIISRTTSDLLISLFWWILVLRVTITSLIFLSTNRGEAIFTRDGEYPHQIQISSVYILQFLNIFFNYKIYLQFIIILNYASSKTLLNSNIFFWLCFCLEILFACRIEFEHF
jgi:hypothetical protein